MRRRTHANGQPEVSEFPNAAERPPGKARNGKRPSQKIALVVLLAALIALAGAPFLLKLSGWGEQARGPTAAIADELRLTDPDPTFVQAATNMLHQAGFAVDYYAGDRVTVDFYRELPKRGYDLIIFRTHAARLRGQQDELSDDAGLFTSEPYSTAKFLDEQRAERVRPARYFERDDDLSVYLGIAPDFVKSSMEGRFSGTLVIMMGCDALRSNMLAEAFLQRGAAAVVGWNGPVSAHHTDAATERFLQHLLQGGLALDQAVTQTMTELGPDPTDGSNLLFYPPEAAALGLAYTYVAR